ncbi:MAG TPA: hypothetical protein VFG21_10670 [Xanthomonadaceae bacterium]|nr:hypothetical protein [Xanthomonadaceae bacterium]
MTTVARLSAFGAITLVAWVATWADVGANPVHVVGQDVDGGGVYVGSVADLPAVFRSGFEPQPLPQ